MDQISLLVNVLVNVNRRITDFGGTESVLDSVKLDSEDSSIDNDGWIISHLTAT